MATDHSSFSPQKVCCIILFLLCFLANNAVNAREQVGSFSCNQIQRFFLLGTAGVTGGYFTVGNALAQEVNHPGADELLIPEATGGSVANLSFLQRGDLDLALIQSDLVWNHYHSHTASAGQTSSPNNGVSRRILVLGALYPEVILVMSRADKDLRKMSDLKGRRVSIGEEGSGTAQNARMILAQLGLDETNVHFRSDNFSRSASALINDEIDALFITGNIPSPLLQNLDARIPLRPLPMPLEIRDRLVANHAFLTLESIPAGTFSQQTEEMPTVGLRALIVTTTDLPDPIAERILKVLFDVFPGRRLGAIFDQISLPKALDGIEPDMLHPVAKRYFSQRDVQFKNLTNSKGQATGEKK